MIIGAHISKESTLLDTMITMSRFGGNALQFFSSNPRSGRSAGLTKYERESERVRAYMKANGFHLVIHSAYVINMSAPLRNGEREMESIGDAYWYQSIVNDLEIAECLGAIGAIVHVGKYTKQTPSAGLDNMTHFVKSVVRHLKDKGMGSKLILETAAGQGTELCVDIDEFIAFCNGIGDTKNFGICFDTCHVWVAGFDIVEAFKRIQRRTRNAICVVHLNGSSVLKGSRKDRHSPILRDSTIPSKTLDEFLIEVKKYPKIQVILETPDNDIKGDIDYVKETKNT